jgi:hypothetical protein
VATLNIGVPTLNHFKGIQDADGGQGYLVGW